MENKEHQIKTLSDTENTLETKNKTSTPIIEDWCTLAREDMEEFIESQGIYIRQ